MKSICHPDAFVGKLQVTASRGPLVALLVPDADADADVELVEEVGDVWSTVVLSREGMEMQPDSCVAPAIRSAAAARMLSVFRWYCMNVPPQCTIGIYV